MLCSLVRNASDCLTGWKKSAYLPEGVLLHFILQSNNIGVNLFLYR